MLHGRDNALSGSLLLFQVNRLVLVPRDGCAYLSRRLAQLGLLIGVEAFLRASGALRPVHALKAAAQAGVAESAVAATVARQLVNHVADLRDLLVDVLLPRILEA